MRTLLAMALLGAGLLGGCGRAATVYDDRYIGVAHAPARDDDLGVTVEMVAFDEAARPDPGRELLGTAELVEEPFNRAPFHSMDQLRTIANRVGADHVRVGERPVGRRTIRRVETIRSDTRTYDSAMVWTGKRWEHLSGTGGGTTTTKVPVYVEVEAAEIRVGFYRTLAPTGPAPGPGAR